ncbi:MAG: outer membrane beta-barrel protein [Acidobacteriota bacterium]
MNRLALALAACVLVTMNAPDAAAQGIQSWLDRGYLNVNVGFEQASETLSDTATFRLYDENGTKGVASAIDSGTLFDVSIGARVWENVSVGLGYHRGTSSGEAAVTASVPNPLFFGRNRNATAVVDGLDRTEYAFHLQIGYMMPVHEKLDVHVFGGPSLFRLRQDVVGDVTFAEQAFPFTNVDAIAVLAERPASATGVNVGVDVTYHLYDTTNAKFGVGGFLRYTAAKADIVILENAVESDLGGIQVGLGARIRF